MNVAWYFSSEMKCSRTYPDISVQRWSVHECSLIFQFRDEVFINVAWYFSSEMKCSWMYPDISVQRWSVHECSLIFQFRDEVFMDVPWYFSSEMKCSWMYPDISVPWSEMDRCVFSSYNRQLISISLINVNHYFFPCKRSTMESESNQPRPTIRTA